MACITSSMFFFLSATSVRIKWKSQWKFTASLIIAFFNFLKVFHLKFRETILVSIQRVSVKRSTTDSCTIVAMGVLDLN